MLLTILGSCRQHSIKNIYNVSNIQEDLSYPHYTKEILEVINYCKYNHIGNNDIINIFRTPILNKQLPNYDNIKNEFLNTTLFVLEIASKIKYEYNGMYVHHIASDTQYNTSICDQITISIQSKEEIEGDILQIRQELNKPFIIVSHLVTNNSGERYNLSEWLEEICKKHNIPFINPVKELIKKNVALKDIFINENVLTHYNVKGHCEILKIYSDAINNINNNCT